jgi:hypothetical protein
MHVHGPCHSLHGYELTSFCRVLSSFPSNFIWNSRWMKRHSSRLFSQFYSFTVLTIIPLLLHTPSNTTLWRNVVAMTRQVSKLVASSLTQHLASYRVKKWSSYKHMYPYPNSNFRIQPSYQFQHQLWWHLQKLHKPSPTWYIDSYPDICHKRGFHAPLSLPD